MIIAHRLLKNRIPSHEYVLLTKNLLSQIKDDRESVELNWQMAAEEFPAIGKVEFNYAFLEELKHNVPDPPQPDTHYSVDNSSYIETGIETNFRNVYALVCDISNRVHWMEGVCDVEQGEESGPYIGSIQYCVFNDFKVLVSPISLNMSDHEIIYAERWTAKEKNFTAIYEFRFRPINNTNCQLANRVLAVEGTELSPDVKAFLMQNLQTSSENLKAYCEKAIKVEYADP